MIKLALIPILLLLAGCINSQVEFRPSLSATASLYNRGGVNESTAQQASTNGVQEIWTDSKGGGALEANIDPNLPAID